MKVTANAEPRQLLMRRSNLENLPRLVVPPGYTLRPVKVEDEASAAETLSRAFEDEWDVARLRAVLSNNAFVKRMCVIVKVGQVVATASAAHGDEHPESGYVHYVAAHPDHAGKKLGYWVTLATLHEFKSLGYKDAVLNTDDHRLPAIKTYLNLGFEPENNCPTHAERWTAIFQRLDNR